MNFVNNLKKTKILLNYLMVVVIIAVSFTACEDDDETVEKTVEKTAEEIAAEEQAEFKDLIGTGIGAYETVYESSAATESFSSLSDDDIDKLDFLEGLKDKYIYLGYENDDFVLEFAGLKIVGADSLLVKGEEDFTLFFAKGTSLNTTNNGDPISDIEEYNIKMTYDIDSDMVYIFVDGYFSDLYLGTIIGRFTAAVFSPSTVSSKSAKGPNHEEARSLASTALSGIYNADVELEAQSWLINSILQGLLSPYGNQYIKLTDLASGKKQVQFCDSSGSVSGNNAATDYNYATTNHFWANNMPMALNLIDVNFTYNSSTGAISNGTSVNASARENNNPSGVTPPFIDLTTQDSGSSASIISTSGNTATSFTIEINLDFEVDVHCIITY